MMTGLRLNFAVAVVLLVVSPMCQAFQPTSWASSLGAGIGHRDITRKAIHRVAVEFLKEYLESVGVAAPAAKGLRTVLGYCQFANLSCKNYPTAVNVILDANSNVDYSDETKLVSKYHMDGEQFEAANLMLIANKQAIVSQIQLSSSYGPAWELLGKSLHTLQDFYSHSNWVEMGNTQWHAALTRSLEIGKVAEPNQTTCSDCVFSISGGYVCTNNIVADILQNNILTSGYYAGENSVKPPGVGKCSHGGILDTSSDSYARGGINKDVAYDLFSPHSDLHRKAAQLAIDATYAFLRDLRDLLGDGRFGSLLGLFEGGSIAIVLDISEGMLPSVTAANVAIQAFAFDLAQQPVSPANAYILSPFSNVNVGPIFATNDPYQIETQLQQVQVGGGGGESGNYVLNGLLYSLKVAMPQSSFFVFTGAPANDASFSSQVLATALEKSVQLNFIVNSIPPVKLDADNFLGIYQALAASTGGQLAVVMDPKDVAPVVREFIKADDLINHAVDLLHVSTSSDSSYLSNTFQVIVDPTISTMIIKTSVMGAGVIGKVTVFPPSSTSSNLVFSSKTEVPPFTAFRINSPSSGVWQIKVESNSNPFTLKVTGYSSACAVISLGNLLTSGAHPGYSPFRGEPVSNMPATIKVDFKQFTNQAVTSAQAFLLNEAGDSLKNIPLTLATDSVFTANITVPAQEFRILASGNIKTDDSVIQFQRINAHLYSPVSFFVEPTLNTNASLKEIDSSFIQIKTQKVLAFSVTNYGNQTTNFTLGAADTLGIVVNAYPSAVILAANQSVTFFVDLFALDSSTVGLSDSVCVTVQDASDKVNYVTTSIAIMPAKLNIHPPIFTQLSFNGDQCLSVGNDTCTSAVWTADVLINATGSGLERVFPRIWNEIPSVRKSEVNLTLANFAKGITTPIKASLVVSCCITQAELLAVDGAGNMNSLLFKVKLNIFAGNYSNKRMIAMIVGITVGAFLLLCVPFIVAMLMYQCNKLDLTGVSKDEGHHLLKKKKDNDNKNNPTDKKAKSGI